MWDGKGYTKILWVPYHMTLINQNLFKLRKI